MVKLNLRDVPFSRFGATMAFNRLGGGDEPETLCLRTILGLWASRQAFNVTLVANGREVESVASADAAALRLESAPGWAEICFAQPDLLRIRARGVGIRLTTYPGVQQYAFRGPGARWQVNSPGTRSQFMLSPLAGRLEVDAPWMPRGGPGRGTRFHCPAVRADFLPDKDGQVEAAVEEFRTTWPQRGVDENFDTALARVHAEWDAWRASMPAVPEHYAEPAELAAYVNWSAVVAPVAPLTRSTVLMSKNWMTQCWSWDHCFNAMALACGQPELAFDQLMTLFDHQDADGALPDAVSTAGVVWNFCKPPIHGWAVRHIMSRTDALDDDRLVALYGPLTRWTNWWLGRDSDGDGVPDYHHGNDSGWDNATVFDGGFGVEGPDLSAYLVVQMDVLAEIAARLGRGGDAGAWTRKADALLDRLIEHNWRGEQFVSPRSGDHAVFDEGDCLLNYLPIVLGGRLPAAIRQKLAAALEPGGRFVTDWGPATESPRSPLYEPNGYWRGPIWAPSTMLVVDGLARGGYGEQAREIARRFCDLCARGGFAENFDAVTGEPLCDRAYTWTSSAFLVLAHEYIDET